MKTMFILLSLGFLTRCSEADTLADEPPQEVVIQGEPTWENGMGELISLKCGYCHAHPKPDIAPDNIVRDMDLNVYETRIVDGDVIRGADAIGRWIYDGILDNEVALYDPQNPVRSMPLDYGTPVTEREKAYFEQWSNNGSKRNQNPEPTQGDSEEGADIWFDECVECHDIGGGVTIDGVVIGPPIRPETLTVAKIKSMWLHKAEEDDPLTDEEAAAVRAFILPLLNKNKTSGALQP